MVVLLVVLVVVVVAGGKQSQLLVPRMKSGLGTWDKNVLIAYNH